MKAHTYTKYDFGQNYTARSGLKQLRGRVVHCWRLSCFQTMHSFFSLLPLHRLGRLSVSCVGVWLLWSRLVSRWSPYTLYRPLQYSIYQLRAAVLPVRMILLLVVSMRSWSLPVWAPGKDLVFALLMLGMERWGVRMKSIWS